VLLTKTASALVEDATLDMDPAVEAALAPLGGAPAGSQAVLEAFRQFYGGLWVGGRLTLTEVALRFAANAANRAVQSGTLDIVVPLTEITSVHVKKAMVTNIVVVGVGYRVVKLRCYGAEQVAGAIDEAIQAQPRPGTSTSPGTA